MHPVRAHPKFEVSRLLSTCLQCSGEACSMGRGYTEASLKSYYEESAAAGWFDQTFGHVMEFDTLDDPDDPHEAEARDMSLGHI